MKNFYNRETALLGKLNLLLRDVTGHNKDFDFRTRELVKLKQILSTANNILTYKTTMAALRWIRLSFSLSDEEYQEALTVIKKTKPNTNGFDIVIKERKIIAEVKNIIPINEGNIYGASQVNGILDDAIKLKNGKKGIEDTSKFYKFIFLSKLSKKNHEAISSALKPWQSKSEIEIRVKRHQIKTDIEYISAKIEVKKLRKTKIYIVAV